MNTEARVKMLDAAGVLARWVLGGLFVYMGLKKAMDPVQFLKLIRQYEMTQTPFLLNAIAAGLPWFEAFCGVLLLAGVAVRGTALALLAMLLPFTWVVLRRALALQAQHALPFCAVKFDCGCGAGEVFICGKLAENAVLILLSCWLLTGAGRALCVRPALFPAKA
jgi:uncharacterized membrane protein YphA (DoxX/SURF4 family)